ncbi:MAG: HK97-gp10 family putative phage morphogenesis protein [Vicinamibacteria bacterium]
MSSKNDGNNLLTVRLVGTEQLLRDLKEADGNVKKVLRAASKAAGDVIKADAISRAPKIRYKKTLVSKASFPKREVCEVTIRPAKKAFYIKFFETGVTAHEIKASGGSLAFEGRTGLVIARGVHHPGMVARPFMRPAFDSKKDEAEQKMGEVFRDAIVAARILQAAEDDED